MTYPTKYTRQYDFLAFSNANPTRPHSGQKINVDYDAVEQSIDEIVEFLKLHTRSDGQIANGVVGRDQLSSDILTLIDAANGNAVAAANVTYDNSGTAIAATSVQEAIDEVYAAITAGGITDIVQDTSPQLGGDLDLNGHVITGLEIGVNVQAYDADLTTWAGLTPSANAQSLVTAADYAAMVVLLEPAIEAAIDTLANLTSVQGLTVTLADAGADALFGWDDSASAYQNLSAADVRTALGLVIGTNVQAYDADLTTWAGLTPSANAQSLVTAADYAAMRALLDLEAGTDFYSKSAADAAFQPLDADLTTIAGLTATSDNFLQAKSSAWASRTPTQVTADLINFVGDSGSGGTKGLVPAPAAGDAAAAKFLKADGTWTTPSGSGDVSKVGTPANNQVGVWTGDGTIEGDSALTFDTATDTLAIAASGILAFGAVNILADSAGTMTLSNIDALDATTEATIEAAIDTLANLTSVQGHTVTLTGAFIRSGAHSLTLTTGATTNVTLPASGTLATLAGSEGLTNKTLTDPVITGTILEDVYTITDGAGFEIDPGNGSIQLITLGASRTPAATNFAAGESVTLMVADGTAYTITWSTVGVTWVGGSAPTLATSGYTVIELWKVGSTIYGARVGDVA